MEPLRPLTIAERRALRSKAGEAREAPVVRAPEASSVATQDVVDLKTDPRFRALTAGVPLAMLAKLGNAPHEFAFLRSTLEGAAEELSGDPALREDFEAILLRGDHEALRRRSEGRLRRLEAAGGGRAEAAAAGLPAFRAWIESSRVLRADRLDVDEYLAPRLVGRASSFGPQDVVVQADRYVYASFEVLPHHMTGAVDDPSALDEDDIADRSELVLMDAADMQVAAKRLGKGFVRAYLDNLLSYREGKEILARYLADVFVSVEEARAVLGAFCAGRRFAQAWDDEASLDGMADALGHSGGPPVSSERLRAIQRRMKELYAATGMMPPLQSEIRVPERARRVPPRRAVGTG